MVLVAITGASGVELAVILLKQLKKHGKTTELVITGVAKKIINIETDYSVSDIIELSDKKAIHILYNCKQVECYHKWKMPKNTCYLMESVERGMIIAIHPDAKITPIQRLYRGYNTKGDPICMSIVEIP